MIDSAHIAYVAGFWEGEGSACVWTSKRGNVYGKVYLTQKDPAALTFIRDTMGMGNVYFRKDNGLSRLVIGKQNDVRRFIRLIYPHVRSLRKRDQLKAAYIATRRKGGH